MKKTSRAVASCFGLLAVVGSGCAQVVGIDGWTETGAGGQGGEQTSSWGAQNTVGSSSAGAGGQSTVGSSSASAGGQSTVGSSSASAGGQSTVGSSSAASSGQTSASSSGTGMCTPDGMPCNDPAECCGNTCNGGVCVGCLGMGTACAGGGCCQGLICGVLWQCCVYQGNCTSDADCCSQACFNGTCGVPCTGEENFPCAADTDCCPGLVCKSTVCAISCASQGDSCSVTSDCCANLVCEGGMCSASCTAQWKPCTTNTDCCPGLMCPAGLCTANPQNQNETEPNGTPVKATVVLPGKVCAFISPSGDTDWFAILLPSGVTLTAKVGPGPSSTCGPGGAIDSEVEIRIPAMSLASNDDIDPATNHCSSAATSVSVPGMYHVRVAASQAKAPTASFSYCLTLTVSP